MTKVIIRPVLISDATRLRNWYLNGDLMCHVGFPNGLDISVDILEKKITSKQKENGLFIIENAQETPIGECSFHELTETSCGVGIKICEIGEQGKGYGFAAMHIFIQYLFDTYNIESIFLDPMVENVRAIKLYEKMGFIEEKILKDCWVDPSGQSRDAVFMRLKREDYK